MGNHDPWDPEADPDGPVQPTPPPKPARYVGWRNWRVSSVLWGLLFVGINLGIFGWLEVRTISAEQRADELQAEHAKTKRELRAARAKPTTPQAQLAHFIEHCNEAWVWIDLKSSSPSCTDRPEGDGVNGPAIVCKFPSPVWDDPPAWVVCDKTGCSLGIRNGVGP